MNKNGIILAMYYAFIFMAWGAYDYSSLYLSKIGIGNFEIGVLTSIGSIVSLLSQPYWGIVSDRSRYKNRVLIFLIFGTMVTTLSVWLIAWSGNTVWLLLLAMAVFSLFKPSITPLSAAIALELSSKGGVRFSSLLMISSVGSAFMSVLAGWLFARNISSIFLVAFLLVLGAFILSLGIPKVEGHQSQQKKVNFTEIFKNKSLVVLYVYALILSITFAFFNSFNAIYSSEQGISTELIGIGIAIGTFSGFPFLIFFEKMYARFGIRNILIFSGMIHALLWILFAYALSPATILLLWAISGGTYGLLYRCLAEYVNIHVIKELKATGQMLNSLVQIGISYMIAGILGGWYTSVFGFQSAFVLCFVLTLMSVAGFYIVSVKFSLFSLTKKRSQSISS